MKKLISILLIFSMLFIYVSATGNTTPSFSNQLVKAAAEQFAELLNGSEGTVCSVSQNVVTLNCSLQDMPNITVPTGGKIIFDMNEYSFGAKNKVSESDTPLFYIPEGAEFEIRNGSIRAAGGYNFCGGIAIENHGTLIINNSVIYGGDSQDTATPGGGGGGGGGGSSTRPSTPYNAVGEMFAETTNNTTNNPGGTAIINYGALTLENSNANGGYAESATSGSAIINYGTITSANSYITGGESREHSSNASIVNSGTFEAVNTYIRGGSGQTNAESAIENSGTLKLDNCNVTGGNSNSGTAGTGITNTNDCYLKDSRIEGGTSYSSKGTPGILNSGNIEFDNSVVFGGHSETDNMPCGNGIDNCGTVTIKSGQVSGCDGHSGGHGIYNYNGASLDIYAPTIPDVFTLIYGGCGIGTGNAIYNEGTLNIYGGEIRGGYSQEYNGSAAIYSTCQFVLNGGTICGGNGACAVIVEKPENDESEYDFIFRGGVLQGGYDDEPEVFATAATFIVEYGYTTAEKNSEFDQWLILRDSSSTKKYLKCQKTLTLSNIGSDVIDGISKSVINIESSAEIADKKIYVATYDNNKKLIDFGVAKHITGYEYSALLPYDFYGNVYTVKIFVWDMSEGTKNESSAEIIAVR